MSQMNHLFNKQSGAYVGISINAVDNNTVGHTAVAPPAELNKPTWDGEEWIEGEPEVTRISKRQGKQQLIILGLDEQVEQIIESIPDPIERKLTQIWYRDADYWELDNEELQKLAAILELSEEQLIEYFQEASKL